MAYQELTSEKYWRASAISEVAQLKEEQNSRSVRAMTQFLIAYLLIAAGAYLLSQNPNWLPATLTFVEQTGICEQLRALVAR